MAVIYLVRHGQASFGGGEYDRLSDLGKRQSQLTGEELATRFDELELLAHGEMTRQRDTADICATAIGSPATTRVLAGFNEFAHEEIIVRHKPAYRNRAVMMADLGRTLRPAAAFQKMFELALDRWISGDHDDYSESFVDFQARAFAAFEQAADGLTGIAVVATSSGAVSAVCAQLLGLGPTGWHDLNRVMVNAGITKVIVGKRGASLVTVNEHGHLERAGRELLTYR